MIFSHLFFLVTVCFLCMVSFRFLSTCKSVDLKSLSSNFNIGFPQGWFFVNLFFLVSGSYFPVLCHMIFSVVENWVFKYHNMVTPKIRFTPFPGFAFCWCCCCLKLKSFGIVNYIPNCCCKQFTPYHVWSPTTLACVSHYFYRHFLNAGRYKQTHTHKQNDLYLSLQNGFMLGQFFKT